MIQQYKKDEIKQLKERLEEAKSIVLIDYKGINVEEVNQLRGRMREEGVDYFISKNTFIKHALNDLGIEDLDDYLKGPTAVAVSKEDEVAPARVIPKFKKEVMEDKDFPTFKAGYIDGELMDVEMLNQLAKLPSKEELLAQVLSGFNAPITGFVGALNGILRKFVLVVDAIRKKEEEN